MMNDKEPVRGIRRRCTVCSADDTCGRWISRPAVSEVPAPAVPPTRNNIPPGTCPTSSDSAPVSWTFTSNSLASVQ